MNYNDIRQILDRFYDGETSLDEEKRLREFFNQNEVPEGFRDEKLMFQTLYEAQLEEVLDQQFDEKILNRIEHASSRVTRMRLIYSLSSVAAVAILLLAVWMGGFFNPQPYGTIDNPQLAFAQTRKALQKVSKNLNKGLNPVKTVASDFNKPLEKVAEIKKMEKPLNGIKQIKEMEKARQLMQSINSVYINLQPNQKKH
jgi:hypothetical protein